MNEPKKMTTEEEIAELKRMLEESIQERNRLFIENISVRKMLVQSEKRLIMHETRIINDGNFPLYKD